jgi:hypothetical protein
MELTNSKRKERYINTYTPRCQAIIVSLLIMDFGNWNMGHGYGVDRTFKKSPCLEIGHVEGQTCNQALQ